MANRAVVFFQGKPVKVVAKNEITFNNLISLASNLETATTTGGKIE